MPSDTFERGQLVVVEWLDALTHPNGWDEIKRKDMKCEAVVSVGFVLHQDEIGLTIAADTDSKHRGKGFVNRAITIPLGMVTKISEVPRW